MSDKTKIEWTDATWNVINGCTLVDDGCKNCYAATLAGTRLKNHPSREGLTKRNAAGGYQFNGQVRFIESELTKPLSWRKPRMVFVCAHGDLFHEDVPDEWIDRVFAVMALCPQHTFQMLTKRPERAREYMDGFADWVRVEKLLTETAPSNLWNGNVYQAKRYLECAHPLPNVWLGTSVSDQPSADKRIPDLLATPAAVRFVSAEPLLGPVDLTRWLIDWVIVGGESGRNARPMHPDWARSLRDQCEAAGVAFFFKQWGEWARADYTVCPDSYMGTNKAVWLGWDGTQAKPSHHGLENPIGVIRVGKRAAGRLLDGREWNQMPGDV
ncbi:phage Gp37/Gp68 family protein [Roseobacter sp. TSBP12]|uniref:DUF5131 family protein n=1 Tax=Roseobacter sp. TSBP12 TaxID=1236613 RepID=UPI00125EE1D7|nr:phage Gp37/Gp68 family protein [Roseobacter sp. TSBP12]KAB6714291.1 phage Gp37/Gp68 family protein [Roseobacter sp. TSBP12]